MDPFLSPSSSVFSGLFLIPAALRPHHLPDSCIPVPPSPSPSVGFRATLGKGGWRNQRKDVEGIKGEERRVENGETGVG